MDHPHYTVTVTSLTRGWTYTTTEGPVEDPAADVQLVDGLRYSWGFKNEQIPGQLDVFTALVNLAGRSATVLPEVQVGDLISIDIRVGETGPRIVAPPPFRAAEPVVTLGTGDYPARMKIPLSDLSIDWRSRDVGAPLGQPTTNPGGDQRNARPYWRERGAEIAVVTEGGGISIGCPAWWDDHEDVASTVTDGGGRPIGGMAYDGLGRKLYEGDLVDVLEAFMNTHQPDGLTHSWATVYAPAGFPTDYRRIGPDDWIDGTPSSAVPYGALTEPDTTVRVVAVPASRKADPANGLPLTLAVVDAILTIVPVEPPATGVYAVQLPLNADWCVLPATARRARDSVTNWLNVEGYGSEPSGEVDGSGVSTYIDAEYAKAFANGGDVFSRGVLARNLPTMIELGQSDDPVYFTGGPEAALIADNFLSDDSALNASWSYDAFTVISSHVPQDVAEWLLPLLAPRLPDETDGDGGLSRHVTIFNIEPALRFSGSPVVGFVTGGTLEFVNGDIVWTLSTAPGLPQWTGAAPAPVTVGDVVDDFGSLTFDNVDPSLSFGDLAYVGAP